MPELTQFRIGICQLTVTPDKMQNLSRARDLIQSAAKQGAILVVLPEMWNCPYSHDFFAKFAEEYHEAKMSQAPTLSMLSEIASSQQITIVGGSIPEKCGNLIYNTCFVFAPDGNLMGKHRKIHLFDLGISTEGEDSFRESDSITAGERPTIIETDVVRLGIGICHDIRFPELAMLYRIQGADLVCYPGAFNMSTGESLWELEQRVRAIDNQLYVVTCSPSRASAGSYMIWGHSTVVGPSGEIIATAGHEETVLIVDIDHSAIQRARESLPIMKHRRDDLYHFIDLHEK